MDAVLSRSTDLALVLFDRDDVCHRLAKRGIPFATFGRRGPPDSAVGGTVISHEVAFHEMAGWCCANGIREVMQLSWFRRAPHATAALLEAGIRCRRRILFPDFSHGRLLGIEEAGFKEFRRMVAAGHIPGSSLFFFTDDYLLRGALQALVGTGINVPGDIRVAAVVNAGSGPFLAQALPRVAIDAEAFGRTMADSTLSFLSGCGYRSGEVGPTWIPEPPLPSHTH
jgi:DNA-binding LacI/PurR family transcriptional regulator